MHFKIILDELSHLGIKLVLLFQVLHLKSEDCQPKSDRMLARSKLVTLWFQV